MSQKKCGKVSIVIPVYKVEKYIDNCIASVIKQTYTNLEVLVVDDGSPDMCPKKCDCWAAKDSRIRVIHQNNMGVSAARNRAIEQLTGDYLLFVDSDDWIAEDMVETLVKKIEAIPKTDAIFCGYTEVNEDGEIIRTVEPNHAQRVCRDEAVKSIFGVYGTFLWNKMFRVELLKENFLFDLDLKIGEDELWMINVLKSARDIYLFNKSLYFYRRRLAGASNDYSLNSKRLSEVVAQQRTLMSIAEYKSEALADLVKCRLYYCGYKIMRLAYYQKNYKIFEEVDKQIEIGRKVWYKTHDNFFGNCRRKIVETMMRMRIPQSLVKIFDKNDILEWKR
ncbi:MAG: glycosyltransferase family 2 protein [Anaerobutyricum hallii]|uniref:glycosyltransferase family 2 protein n=1 Tax=Anaerobutyricum hallii TaxID=39488 RepID=UPI002A7F9D3D|nr:glycosyltransferase family 2 protein [Anaerobutyricum hallii]MDY4576588.1 glycosyltransferase family 2 protein [Anaerobutyricum hallii]